MRRRAPIQLVTVALALALGSCGDGASSPVPQPVPFLIRHSSPAPSAVRVLVVGLPGAVAGVGRVHIRDLTSSSVAFAESTAEGTFGLSFEASATPALEGWFETGDGTSAPVTLTMRSLGEKPELGQTFSDIVSPGAQPQTVLVSNDAGAGQPLKLSASPDVNVVVSNISTGAVATTTTDAEGPVSVTIAAAPGDVITIMLVDPDDPYNTSDFVELIVST